MWQLTTLDTSIHWNTEVQYPAPCFWYISENILLFIVLPSPTKHWYCRHQEILIEFTFSIISSAHTVDYLDFRTSKLNLHKRLLSHDFTLLARSPAGCLMTLSVHIFITEVSVLSACSLCWSWPCLPHSPHPPVDNSPYSSWGVVLHFSCNLMLTSTRCLTSCCDQSCHLHFTLPNPFPPVPVKPPVPQAIYHPV